MENNENNQEKVNEKNAQNNDNKENNTSKEKNEIKDDLVIKLMVRNYGEQEKENIEDKKIENNNENEDNKINENINKQNNNSLENDTNQINQNKIKEDANVIKTTEENKNEIKSGIITQENDYINITEDGGIKKRILKEGNGAFPKDGNEVIIDYIGKFNDDIFDHSNENEPFPFTIGENKVTKGLEIAVKTMKLGENSEFIMTPEYIDDETKKNQNIPQNSILTYKIELKSIHYKNTEESLENLTYEEKLQWGKLLKQNGVEKFKENDISEAKKCFLNALSFLKTMNPEKEEEKEGVDLFLSILANICNCYNKEKDYDSIIKFAFIGINIKPTPKLLYFRTIAFANLEDFENAENDLKDLINLFASNGEENSQEVNETINYLKELIQSRIKIYEEKNKIFSRSIYRQVFHNNKTLRAKILVPEINPNPHNPVVFFEIQIENDNIGKIEFELFKDVAPITSENFRNLCIGTQEGLTYKNSSINKIIKDFVIGGGIIEYNNEENKCIYGQYFDDENYTLCHCRRGLLTMDNDGKNKNNSRFLITLKHIPWFDGRHVVFGQIINGMDIIKAIEDIETDKDDKPLKRINIINCGEIIKIENDDNMEKKDNKIKDYKEMENIDEENIIKNDENTTRIKQNEETKITENKEDINKSNKNIFNNNNEMDKSKEKEEDIKIKTEKKEEENTLMKDEEVKK